MDQQFLRRPPVTVSHYGPTTQLVIVIETNHEAQKSGQVTEYSINIFIEVLTFISPSKRVLFSNVLQIGNDESDKKMFNWKK